MERRAAQAAEQRKRSRNERKPSEHAEHAVQAEMNVQAEIYGMVPDGGTAARGYQLAGGRLACPPSQDWRGGARRRARGDGARCPWSWYWRLEGCPSPAQPIPACRRRPEGSAVAAARQRVHCSGEKAPQICISLPNATAVRAGPPATRLSFPRLRRKMLRQNVTKSDQFRRVFSPPLQADSQDWKTGKARPKWP